MLLWFQAVRHSPIFLKNTLFTSTWSSVQVLRFLMNREKQIPSSSINQALSWGLELGRRKYWTRSITTQAATSQTGRLRKGPYREARDGEALASRGGRNMGSVCRLPKNQ
jgi:hypothetical protein